MKTAKEILEKHIWDMDGNLLNKIYSAMEEYANQPQEVDKEKVEEFERNARGMVRFLIGEEASKNTEKVESYIQTFLSGALDYAPTPIFNDHELEQVFGKLEEDSCFTYDYGSLIKGAKTIINLLKLNVKNKRTIIMTKVKVDELVIQGVTYVPKESLVSKAESKDGMPYTLIRTYSAGVFTGYLKEQKGKEVILLEAIRIWKWSGAASLSQLAMEGTNNKEGCKFGMPISTSLKLTEVTEMTEMTEVAKQSIKNVESWKK